MRRTVVVHMGAVLWSAVLHVLHSKQPLQPVQNSSLQFYVDYHALNKLIIKDTYLLPQHKDLLD